MSGTAPKADGYLLLEDGTRFDGVLHGATEGAGATGEVVFNTSMTGYQEAVTDPSYAGQIITFTYPLVGNYGVAAAAMESDRVHARGVIMREAKNSEDAADAEGGWIDWLRDCGVVGIDGIDTRALVRHIRDRGAMRGGIFPAELAEGEGRERVDAEPPMDGADLARSVTPADAIEFEGDGPHVVGIDTGIKLSIIRQFRQRNCRMTLLPCTASAEEVLERDPDMVFLANGPGDPAALDYVVGTVREVVGKRPVVGICLGHQLLCRAVGLETFKLPFGHRGANHPVKDLHTGRIEITSQNHGFAVQGPAGEPRIEADEPVRWETEFGAAELSHLNLYDRTVEGLVLRDVPGATVQYHPEAGAGPPAAPPPLDRVLGRGGGGEGPHRQAPPGGGPGPARRPLPLRSLPGAGAGMRWPPARVPLEGSIVRLEPIASGHHDGLLAASREPATWTWIDRRVPADEGAFTSWFEARLAASEAGSEWCFVTISAADGDPIGSSSFLNVRPEHDGLEIGWTWLHPGAWRTGANLEAKLLMLALAFDDLGCMRVEFKTDARNDRSRAALAALPAKFEGIFRKHMLMPVVGVRDSAYFSILDEEWPEVRANLERRLARETAHA